MARRGARLVVADGCTLLCRPFVAAAERAGFEVVVLEVATTAHMAAGRKRTREGAEPTATAAGALRNRWPARRAAYESATTTLPQPGAGGRVPAGRMTLWAELARPPLLCNT